MHKRIRGVLVVGGGTAGWLSALFLNRSLNRATEHLCDITLIESADVHPIGVGEATVPTLRETMLAMGLSEDEWMVNCNATFKTAIKFVNWSGTSASDIFWHPFTPALPVIHGCPMSQFWLRRKLRGCSDPFDRTCSSAVQLSEGCRSAKTGGEPRYQGTVNYAYHLDAALLAEYLQRKARASGVKRVVDNIVSVSLDDRGYVDHVVTARSGNLTADLYIDCTGFRGLLINEALQEPFIPYRNALLCDAAVAVSASHENGATGLNPFTTSTAVSAGWIWDIPLYNRRGVGYVYSSDHISKEAAAREFLKYLGDAAESSMFRHIKMRVGRTDHLWVKNCVAIGLSGGFIEPLESTGIYLIEMGLRYLWSCFPDREFDQSLSSRYNRIMRRLYEHVRDFIVLHYRTTKREDTEFWKDNRYKTSLSDSLEAKLDQWRAELPSAEDIGDFGLFREYSFTCILAGMGYLPEHSLPILDYGYDALAEQEFGAIRNQTDALMNSLPDHRQYLRHLRSGQVIRNMGP